MLKLIVRSVALNGPDEFGFLYGFIPYKDTSYSLNVLPPLTEAAHWLGRQMLYETKPHASQWTLIIEGEVISKVDRARFIDVELDRLESSGEIDTLIGL